MVKFWKIKAQLAGESFKWKCFRNENELKIAGEKFRDLKFKLANGGDKTLLSLGTLTIYLESIIASLQVASTWPNCKANLLIVLLLSLGLKNVFLFFAQLR